MIWLSVSQETAEVCGPRLINGQPGLGTLMRAVDEDYEACSNMAHVVCRRVRQVWGAWRVQNGPFPVNKPDAPPRETDAMMG
jgi:hypothetical protein